MPDTTSEVSTPLPKIATLDDILARLNVEFDHISARNDALNDALLELRNPWAQARDEDERARLAAVNRDIDTALDDEQSVLLAHWHDLSRHMLTLPAQTIGGLRILAKVFADEFGPCWSGRDQKEEALFHKAKDAAIANIMTSIDQVAG